MKSEVQELEKQKFQINDEASYLQNLHQNVLSKIYQKEKKKEERLRNKNVSIKLISHQQKNQNLQQITTESSFQEIFGDLKIYCKNDQQFNEYGMCFFYEAKNCNSVNITYKNQIQRLTKQSYQFVNVILQQQPAFSQNDSNFSPLLNGKTSFLNLTESLYTTIKKYRNYMNQLFKKEQKRHNHKLSEQEQIFRINFEKQLSEYQDSLMQASPNQMMFNIRFFRNTQSNQLEISSLSFSQNLVEFICENTEKFILQNNSNQFSYFLGRHDYINFIISLLNAMVMNDLQYGYYFKEIFNDSKVLIYDKNSIPHSTNLKVYLALGYTKNLFDQNLIFSFNLRESSQEIIQIKQQQSLDQQLTPLNNIFNKNEELLSPLQNNIFLNNEQLQAYQQINNLIQQDLIHLYQNQINSYQQQFSKNIECEISKINENFQQQQQQQNLDSTYLDDQNKFLNYFYPDQKKQTNFKQIL